MASGQYHRRMFLREKFRLDLQGRQAMPAKPPGEYEIKYYIPGHASAALESWMAHRLEPHPAHHTNTICSIYFDTGSLSSLEEKASSFYEKTKFRIRWYTDSAGGATCSVVFLEVKAKEGSQRRKTRFPISLTPAEAASLPLERPEWAEIIGRHAPNELNHHGPLHAVLELRYRRVRYVHRLSGDSFCLDSQIRCTRSHPAFLPAATGRSLRHDVFEQKGSSQDPVPALRALPRFGARRASLSKYYLAAIGTLDSLDSI